MDAEFSVAKCWIIEKLADEMDLPPKQSISLVMLLTALQGNETTPKIYMIEFIIGSKCIWTCVVILTDGKSSKHLLTV